MIYLTGFDLFIDYFIDSFHKPNMQETAGEAGTSS